MRDQADRFASGRHLSAWLGMTPSEYSSGARRLLGQGQCLRAHLADPWRKGGTTGSQTMQGANTRAADPAAKLGTANRRTHRPQQGCRGAGEQTGKDLLGGVVP